MAQRCLFISGIKGLVLLVMLFLNQIPTTGEGMVYITLPTAGLLFCASKQDPTEYVNTPIEAGTAQVTKNTGPRGRNVRRAEPSTTDSFLQRCGFSYDYPGTDFKPQHPWC